MYTAIKHCHPCPYDPLPDSWQAELLQAIKHGVGRGWQWRIPFEPDMNRHNTIALCPHGRSRCTALNLTLAGASALGGDALQELLAMLRNVAHSNEGSQGTRIWLEHHIHFALLRM